MIELKEIKVRTEKYIRNFGTIAPLYSDTLYCNDVLNFFFNFWNFVVSSRPEFIFWIYSGDSFLNGKKISKVCRENSILFSIISEYNHWNYLEPINAHTRLRGMLLPTPAILKSKASLMNIEKLKWKFSTFPN